MRLACLLVCLTALSACSISKSTSPPSLAEVPLVSGQFHNTQADRGYMYAVDMGMLVAEQHREHVESVRDARMGRITESLTVVFYKATPGTLNEPGRLKLKQEILKACQDHFGDAPDGNPYVTGVSIRNWKRFSADGASQHTIKE